MMGTGKLHSSPKRLISTVFFIIRQKVGALKNRVNQSKPTHRLPR